MKILVTGFHLAQKLLERGDEVVGLDNINDVNLKYAELGISNKFEENTLVQNINGYKLYI